MDDRTLVMAMVNGIGANLTNEEKRAHLLEDFSTAAETYGKSASPLMRSVIR